nr:hypothetical protein Iba_chr03bCG16820 [Ipomoea batatas]GME16648.1 hypothetical protein Iba_scaffold17804CG0310 [Ipomoea batatas]
MVFCTDIVLVFLLLNTYSEDIPCISDSRSTTNGFNESVGNAVGCSGDRRGLKQFPQPAGSRLQISTLCEVWIVLGITIQK